MSDFEKLIDEVVNAGQELENEHEHREPIKEFNRKYFEEARTALTDAISAVTSERDTLLKITDVPEGQESAFYSCDKCGNYLPRVSALEHQLKDARAKLAEMEMRYRSLLESIAMSRPCHPGEPAYEFMVRKTTIDEGFTFLARLAKDES